MDDKPDLKNEDFLEYADVFIDCEDPLEISNIEGKAVGKFAEDYMEDMWISYKTWCDIVKNKKKGI